MGPQSYTIEKAISPFLSDQVTFVKCTKMVDFPKFGHNYRHFIDDVIGG